MKLIILFLVGLALAGGSFAYLFYGPGQIYPDKIYTIIPGAIGIALIMLSATYGMRKADRYLDK